MVALYHDGRAIISTHCLIFGLRTSGIGLDLFEKFSHMEMMHKLRLELTIFNTTNHPLPH